MIPNELALTARGSKVNKNILSFIGKKYLDLRL